MNIMDMLLQLDETKLVKPKKQVEMKRLSEILGDKVVFNVEAITPDKMSEIQDMSIDYEKESVNLEELQVMTVIEGTKEPNFKSKELMDKFKVYTPKDLVKKLLLPGEIISLYNMIGELSGFNGETVEEVKN
ncbi:MAG: hypothetical protein N4A57_04840 [Anaeromicrobium sp.]|jgi:hypothetical protein|uniref:phage tail assembly chaperone n=1 Tax=Anaeromicrobium sp. TaxID=1929132 RepID=UPI0025D6EF4B|nr:hypothetical protein [Anaeromicrobium sp.]MCT4593584.1 hypothetical protein [Anaeromicrobium sp.]